jgi:hypothetical protein
LATKQAGQSTALAFTLIATLGFLGYTTLSDDKSAAQPQPPKQPITAVAPVTVAAPVPGAVKSAGLQLVEGGAPVSASKEVEPAAMPLSGLHTDTNTLGTAAAIAPVVAPSATLATPLAASPTAPVIPDAAPVAPLPPAPVVAASPATLAKPVVRRPIRRVKPAPAREKEPIVMAPPVESPVTTPAVTAPTETLAAKPAVAPHAPAKVGAPATAPSPASHSVSLPFSKEEMTVTISGDQAWVQVSPTRTMPARKGDVLPNLGKILEIRKNEVVAEKGTLTTN